MNTIRFIVEVVLWSLVGWGILYGINGLSKHSEEPPKNLENDPRMYPGEEEE